MDQTQSFSPNPLTAFMRQPKIYITLPSGGKYWRADCLDLSATGEYPVYSMTAQDELLLKIPDALMNGQAVVDVIQNCIPNIKDAWGCPTLDIDTILIAIRIATYGESMTTPITFGDDLELEYQMDLRTVKDQLISQISWDPVVTISPELTVFVRPLYYKEFSESAVQTFETQKIMQIVGDDNMSEEDKLRLFKDSFTKLTQVTLASVAKGIYQVDSVNGSTTNPQHIAEFVNNMDKDLFNKIQSHIDSLADKNKLKPITVSVTDEMREKGITGDTIDVPLTFDAATFFA
jgi:hypothetical protein